MKNLDDIFNLVTGNVAPEQKKEVYSAIKEESESEELYRKAKVAWAFMASTRKMSDYKIEKSYKKLQSRISSKTGLRIILPAFVRYAAAVILLAGVSALMFYLGRQDSGDMVSELKYTSVVAEKGQISKVILPDSSIVWLNSGTTLIYDNKFSQNNRNLILKGQAFLEVRKNKNLPLIVASGDLRVKVLGTRFDVCAYPDEKNIQVFLESGKVELSSINDNSFKYNLKPGEMAEYYPLSNKMMIKKIAGEDYPSWQNGTLIFRDTPMGDVIKRLERKFDIEFAVNDSSVYKSVFNANFKNESLKEILDYIQFSCPIKYQRITEKGTVKSKIILSNRLLPTNQK